MIFNIQRYSLHDGTGIRTIIFYKGCPLRCQWCSNPESQSFDYSLMYDSRKCRSFGECINEEPSAIKPVKEGGIVIDREKISSVKKLNNICPSKALTVSGEYKSADDLIAEIDKDKLFFRSDGGVTLSGGEPLAQDEELDELLVKLKAAKISVNVETSLHVSWPNIERCIGLVDTFLVDLKHIDKEKFEKFTGGDSSLVLENLARLTGYAVNVIIRIPVLPGFNHSMTEMVKMIDYVSTLNNIKEIDFLPYHTLGLEKYRMLGEAYLFTSGKPVQESELSEYIHYAESKGFQTKSGG